MALTGDRGVGKKVLMAQLADALDAPAFQATAPMAHTQELQALEWLSQVAQVQTGNQQ